MLLVSFSSIPQNVALNNDKYIGDDDSTTLAQLKAKVDYGLEKLSDFIHTKRSLNTRLYNISQRQKFDNSSILSQKVINYLLKSSVEKLRQLFHMLMESTRNAH